MYRESLQTISLLISVNPKKIKTSNYVQLNIDGVKYIITDTIKHKNVKETSGIVSLKLIFNMTIIIPRILEKKFLFEHIIFERNVLMRNIPQFYQPSCFLLHRGAVIVAYTLSPGVIVQH